MPRAKKGYAPKIQLLDMPLPFAGQDTSFAYAQQRPGTTPTAVNVRGFNAYSGRRALARRKGTVKGFNNQIYGSAGMQELNTLIGTGFVTATGNYIPGSYYYSANVLVGGGPGVFTDGKLANWQNGTLKWTLNLANEPSQAAATDSTGTGSDGSGGGGHSDGFYIYSFDGANNFVTKYSWEDGSQIWRTNLGNVSGGGPGFPQTDVGMAVGGGIVYISIVTVGIYRLRTSDGVAPSANPWVSDATINTDHPGWMTDQWSTVYQTCYLGGYYTHPLSMVDGGGHVYLGTLLMKADGTKTYLLNASGYVNPEMHTASSQGYVQDGTYFYNVQGYGLVGNNVGLAVIKFLPGGTVVNSAVTTVDITTLNPFIAFDGASNALDVTDVLGNIDSNGNRPYFNIPTSTLTPTARYTNIPLYSVNGGYGSRAFFTAKATPGYWSDGVPANWTNNDQYFTPQFLITANPGVGNADVSITNYNRQVTLVGVSAGNVAVAYNRSWSIVVNGVGALDSSVQVIRSDSNLGNLYFADGVNWKYYHPATNAVLPWTASAGTLPVDTAGNKPRLIATWNGRTVLSGLPYDPQNWFMSASGDPTNFDYNPSPTVETQAVAGNNSPAGHVGDVITALIPYNDDVLIFGGDHTIWQMTGDPMAGGRIDRISDITGIAWGNAWCKTPNGGIYFFGSRGSVYYLNFSAVAAAEGQQLNRVSQAIDQELSQLNMGAVVVRMAYEDRWQGLNVFISALDGSASTHYYYDEQTQSWWSDQYANNAHNPFCVLVFDGDAPDDRNVLLGDQDGWVRQFSDSALDDDGTIISSSVLVGPNGFKGGWEYMLNDLQADIDLTGGSVNWGIKPGFSAQTALQAPLLFSGTFGVGRNHSQAVRAAGIACYVQFTRAVSELPWAIESLRGKITIYPHTRQRVF